MLNQTDNQEILPVRNGVRQYRRFIFFAGSILIVGFLIFALLALGMPTDYPGWVPAPVVNSFYDFRLEVAPWLKKVISISSGSIRNDRVYVDDYGERIEFNEPDLTIVGTLYKPDSASPAPAIVIVHGSSPEGRRLGIYRYLGKALSERGYVDLTIDLRGYGESGDPVLDGNPSLMNAEQDVLYAFDYLSSLSEVLPDQIFVIGHSGGSNEALEAGIEDEGVRKIILIGPPRRVEERISSEQGNEFDYFRRRLMRYMRLDTPIPAEIYQEYSQSMQMENFSDYLMMPAHKPLLLIDGELESEADRIYLEKFFESIAEPKSYFTLSGTDHYASIANFGSIVFYDKKVADDLVDKITTWLDADD